MQSTKDVLFRLGKSKFRSGFYLKEKEKSYYNEKGDAVIRSHAEDFINSRIAPKEPKNDGKQTPTHSHPVFVAMHATACCCRGCLEKWHKIPKGRELTPEEKNFLVELIMDWIQGQI